MMTTTTDAESLASLTSAHPSPCEITFVCRIHFRGGASRDHAKCSPLMPTYLPDQVCCGPMLVNTQTGKKKNHRMLELRWSVDFGSGVCCQWASSWGCASKQCARVLLVPEAAKSLAQMCEFNNKLQYYYYCLLEELHHQQQASSLSISESVITLYWCWTVETGFRLLKARDAFTRYWPGRWAKHLRWVSITWFDKYLWENI